MPTRETDTTLVPKLRVLTVREPSKESLLISPLSDHHYPLMTMCPLAQNVTHTDWVRNPPDITQQITHSIIHISYLSPKEQQMIKLVLILCVRYSFTNVLSYHID